jgi:DNA-binding GntR family transcriptional regulator
MEERADGLRLTAGPWISRTEGVESAIRDAILSGDLPPGSPLVERDLAASLGVSKTPVREAIKALAKKGLVAANAYQRSSVVQLDAAAVQAIYEVRSILEPPATRLAVERHRAETYGDASAALEQAREALASASMVRLSGWNREFHAALFRHCGNDLLIEQLLTLHDRVALASLLGWRLNPTWVEELGEHERILTTVRDGTPEDVEGAVRDHIVRFGARLVASLGPDEGG